MACSCQTSCCSCPHLYGASSTSDLIGPSLLCLQLPDHVLLCVCPMTGLSKITREHLAVALALEVPVAVVLTKADVAPPTAMAAAMQDIR